MTGGLTIPGLTHTGTRTRLTGFDSNGVHLCTYSVSDDSDIIGGLKRIGNKDYDLRVYSGGYSRVVFHEANHHTYQPVNKAGIETGTTVYCSLERKTSSDTWYIVFHNTSVYSLNMTWKVLELA